MENKTFFYGRISSNSQREDNNRQLEAFKKYGIDDMRNVFFDVESGKNFSDRKQYQIMKSILRSGDKVIIKSLDRFSRSYNDLFTEWKCITKDIGADIIILDMPLLDTTKNKDLLGSFISDLILQVLGYVAEQERLFTKSRQREGIDIALKYGTKTGRPFGRPKINKPDNYDEVIKKWKDKKITAREAMRQLNLKPNTFYCMIKNDR